ncbi:MFS transporter [Opitutus sp. ER46]|uniref:MFS transporter n=1 Tax=Opitutus sp. ER46 TaxID=2161864 RepID=UPI000D2FED9F|nr:MFS transporter [Opitutus sp. ER46]PTX91557.1 MFS transporter [Opitutus sp. ER46]
MAAPTERLSFREKSGYAVGDIATNFFFQSMILYQTRFYTDTVGLSAVAVGMMFLVLRLADALVDPVVGALSDRTQTRWGKFRPWILWTAVPFGLVFWLVYLSPSFGPMGKLVYAYMTYTLVMMLYSANNTPYSALMGVMTPDAGERTSVASYRFVAALVGQFIVQALTLPLVDKFGQGNSAHGWAVTMGILGVAIVVLNLIVFATTKERVLPMTAQKSSLKQDLKDVFTCGPWLVMFVLTLLIFTTLVVRGSSLNYFCSYFLDQGAVRSFLENLGLGTAATGVETGWWKWTLGALGLLVKPDGSNAAGVGFSLMMVAGSLIQIVGIICSKPLADRFGKKAVFISGMAVTMLATVMVFFVTPTSMNLLVFASILWPLGWGPTVPLLWVMIADVADYSEWKTSRRATGFMYAGILFALKAGLGLGGALSGWIIAAYGYVPNAVQSPHALLGIRLGASIYAAIPFALGLVCLAIYPIGKALNLRIQDELAERRRQMAAGVAAAS